MINWIKNKLFQKATIDEVDETPVEVEEIFAPVGVRVKPAVAVRIKPADTYIQGYTVDEGGIGTDDVHATTVNDIKTTGADPYNTGHIDLSANDKSVPEK